MPKDHFDIAYSIYALGWSTDLLGTLVLIHSYLKPGGYYIFSWEHPFFSCLEAQGLKVGVSKPYLPEVADHNAKWRGSGGVVMHRRSMSTYLNALISAGFVLERIVEPPMPGEFHADACKPDVKWYSPLKAGLITTTFIVKARKPA